jgi:sugar lactone lactonase YvrE
MKKRILLSLFLSAAALVAALLSTSIYAAPGDLYVADTGARAIFKFAPAGTKSTFASGLFQPFALAFDHEGNLFVADSGACVCAPEPGCGPCPPTTIFRFTPAGAKSVFVSSTELTELLGMAFDSSGNRFVSDNGVAIYKFTPDGTQSTFASGLKVVSALAFDSSGNLYTAESSTGLILKFTPDGRKSTFASVGGNPAGLAFDGNGNLFVDDNVNGTIWKITPAGTKSMFGSGVLGQGLAFDREGNLFAADVTKGTIFKFTPAGIKSTFASGLPDPNLLAFEPVVEKLCNVSARGLVGTGDNVLIGGFIVGGNALNNNAVVVRAIGPSLSRVGVTNPLQDPTLELHDASGAIIASNNNWQDTQRAQIIATHLAPTNPRESAILATLSAGTYTAIVRGAGNATGVALVEVYSTK